ncbi:hypothetical protein CAPN010_04340 [Capnocytophaga cynodegmi]|uniref:Uncharacterized protein n=1 Tax=Capnocytophaga canis TaxID=1848903 RepID=A0A0B7IFS5_9FLAO|nr:MULTISPECIES: hypothetical protein [Capnocytophaga]ATA74025.1 hypothetical protein CGC52_00345 [Capnocytophaga sp. H2931]CEN46166.1 conserved hypothetical protein [Capnocytophaga canis]CEN48813.1 conserved hypothetical protein [Capnocytophaga canis]GIM60687.1 hypothetical protein CAPN008_07370 [Capnocytophaga canis]GJQ06276.1 hypothetical protein CAPN010_04340 [Capnocytophaga cynodegmi]
MTDKNLASVVFTAEELQKLDEALQNIENVLKGKTFNLTPDERRQYGSIAEQNKLFVNKCKEFMEQYPQFVPSFLDKEEFDRDYQARQQIETRLIRLKTITEQLSDTKVLLDNDNYFNSITFYRNVKFLSGQNVPGIKTLYEQLKQFFKGGRKKADV